MQHGNHREIISLKKKIPKNLHKFEMRKRATCNFAWDEKQKRHSFEERRDRERIPRVTYHLGDVGINLVRKRSVGPMAVPLNGLLSQSHRRSWRQVPSSKTALLFFSYSIQPNTLGPLIHGYQVHGVGR